jgi:ketosteroid isomerase-like protein
MRIAFISALVLAATSGAALAGPIADKAKAHFAAIAEGDVAKITADYSDKAVFQWVGGPLDGVYSDPAAIKGVWAKFTSAQGKLEADVKDIQEAVNPKGGTVTANIVFKGKGPIPLCYVLVYRDGKIVNEVWQINPPSQ